MTSRSGDPQVWLPVVDGTERLGVLGLTVPDHADTDDPLFHERCRLLGHLTGHLIAAKRPYGDALDQFMRLDSRSVAAELLHGPTPSGDGEPPAKSTQPVPPPSVLQEPPLAQVMDGAGPPTAPG